MLCGWRPNPDGVQRWLSDSDNRHPIFGTASSHLVGDEETVLLYEPLIRVKPTWKRGTQGIGSCVGWGYELASTAIMAIQAILDASQEFPGEAATEAIYGGSRVEAEGTDWGGWSDGSYGAAAAKWLKQYGVLLRTNYATQTGISDHDLRLYSATKEKNWGAYGCGGKNDNGKLDAVAKAHPVKTTSLVMSFSEAAKAIGVSKCPVPVCSNQGFTQTRDAEGFCRPSGRWSHCMCFLGVRYGSRPGLLCFNSWGVSNTGPRWPDTMPDAVADCSFWVDADTCDSMFAGEDSFALSDVDGFVARSFPNFGTGEYL